MRRIVIGGGGIAGLECLRALRALAGDAPRITLVTDRVWTLDRQRPVVEALGLDRTPRQDVVAVATAQHADLHLSRLAIVREGSVVLGNGMELPYDDLVVATGARLRQALPGATTFRGMEDVAAIRVIRRQLLAREIHSVAFAVPSESTWPLPLFNLALAIGVEAAAAGLADARLTIVTPGEAPPASGGGDALAQLLDARRIVVRTGARPRQLRDGQLLLSDGHAVPAERVIALGEARGCPPAGLASDRDGFLPVDTGGSVRGWSDVFAAGDVTAHSPKHGALAVQQADAVAETIAARLGVTIAPAPDRPRGRWLRPTGDAARSRADLRLRPRGVLTANAAR